MKIFPVMMLFIACSVQAATAWLDDGQRIIHAQIAATDAQRATGLMYRVWLLPGSGMLFIFDPSQPVSFWMKNTLIPLDMRFYDRNGQPVAYYPHARPCSRTPCRLYPAQGDTAYVLETRAAATPVLSRHIPPLRRLFIR